MGDLVNTTARLASVASAGEILVTLTAAEAARLSPSLPHRWHPDMKLASYRQTVELTLLMAALLAQIIGIDLEVALSEASRP